MCQRGETELDNLPGSLTNRSMDGRRECGQVKGQDRLSAGGQQFLAVQAVVGRTLGSVRFHDVLKVAAEGVLCTATRAGDQEGGFEGWVMVVEKRFRGSEERGRFHAL